MPQGRVIMVVARMRICANIARTGESGRCRMMSWPPGGRWGANCPLLMDALTGDAVERATAGPWRRRGGEAR